MSYTYMADEQPNHKGVKNNKAKLSEKMVYEIRALTKEAKISQARIAQRYHVSGSTISNIYNRRTWSHLPERPRKENS